MIRLLIISGPAGVGKTTICERLIDEFSPSLSRVITVTSRQPRPLEIDGKDYIFISTEEFLQKVRANEFIEYEKVHGNYYGTLRSSIVLSRMQGGLRTFLVNIDVKGAKSIKEELRSMFFEDCSLLSIFIRPSSLEVLEERMLHRGDKDQDEIRKRMETAKEEITSAKSFDLIVESKDKDHDYLVVKKKYLEFFS